MSRKTGAQIRVDTLEDAQDRVERAIARLKKAQVYVGIASGSRGDKRSDAPISNHELGFIHEFGSPAANIPARPFLRPGVRKAIPEYKPKLKAAAKAALHGDIDAMDALLNQAGMIARDGARTEISTGDFVPLKPATLRNRHKSRLANAPRENELKGEDVRPLINTGALRDSIDYYVKGAK